MKKNLTMLLSIVFIMFLSGCGYNVMQSNEEGVF